MEINRPGRSELTPEEQQHLERLKQIIEQATADGKLSKYEIDQIRGVIWSNGQVSPEELEIVTKLVKDKIASGELSVQW